MNNIDAMCHKANRQKTVLGHHTAIAQTYKRHRKFQAGVATG